MKNIHKINKNIYITSDEQPKEGDYCLSKLNEIVKFHSGYDYRYYAKIILTTDQDLIKKGVQSIDDEFLEWFVKNPSCEEVEIGEGTRYEDEWIDNEDGGEIFQHQYCSYKIIIPKEEPKQETLEEAFDRIYNSIDFTEFDFASFKLGAKWQQERMYSEEDMISFAEFVTTYTDKNRNVHGQMLHAKSRYDSAERTIDLLNIWFEQFKKK